MQNQNRTEYKLDKSVPTKAMRTARVLAAEHGEDIRYALLRTSTASQAVRELEGDR